jgi:hypothetical protein
MKQNEGHSKRTSELIQTAETSMPCFWSCSTRAGTIRSGLPKATSRSDWSLPCRLALRSKTASVRNLPGHLSAEEQSHWERAADVLGPVGAASGGAEHPARRLAALALPAGEGRAIDDAVVENKDREDMCRRLGRVGELQERVVVQAKVAEGGGLGASARAPAVVVAIGGRRTARQAAASQIGMKWRRTCGRAG